jgi:hypothetical protein
MEPRGSLPSSQELFTCTYPEPDQSIHLRLGLPSGLFPSGFPTNNLYTFLFSFSSSSIRATSQMRIL